MIDPYLPERGNSGYEVRHHQLELALALVSNRLEGVARLHIVSAERLERFTLDLEHLEVVRVTVDGRAARWRQRPGKVVVTPASAIDAGRAVVVEVRYQGSPRPAASPCGPVGWEELDDGVLVASQPSGAPTWFPCNDVAAQKASFDVSIETTSTHRAIANGALRSSRRRGSTTTWRYEQSEPTSAYLMSLHVGRYDERTVVHSDVPLRMYAPPSLWSEVAFAFQRLPAMVDAFVERFGPYPFAAGYAVVVCPEALEVPVEAQGQAAFGTNHLDGSSERLVAHELAHQWFGNSVTAATWRDVWLHEGFCAYAEWLWSEASGDRPAAALAREHHARVAREPQDILIGDPGPDDMFDDRVYKRGALAVHALRTSLGDARFFEVLREWCSKHEHGVASTEDLVALTGAGDVLRPWLYEVTLPAMR